MKISCGYDDKGNIKLFKKQNFQFRTKGNRYSIPYPVGGRKVQDLLLNEDDYNQPKVKKYIQYLNAQEKKRN